LEPIIKVKEGRWKKRENKNFYCFDGGSALTGCGGSDGVGGGLLVHLLFLLFASE